MASSDTFTGLASEADCLFSCQNISGTGESESELGQHSLTNSTQRKLWHVLDRGLMSCPLVLPRTSSKHSLSMTWRSVFEDALWTPYRDTTAGSECHTGMGDKEWLQVCSPQVQSHTFHCTTVSGSETPPLWGLETHFCQWRSPRSSLGCGGTRTSHLRSTSVCWRHSARRLSNSSEWSLTWNGKGTETHSWCCTVALFVRSLTMVALCMARHQTPTYDKWTAFITLDRDLHWEHSAPAQCPACTQRPTKLHSRNVS